MIQNSLQQKQITSSTRDYGKRRVVNCNETRLPQTTVHSHCGGY